MTTQMRGMQGESPDRYNDHSPLLFFSFCFADYCPTRQLVLALATLYTTLQLDRDAAGFHSLPPRTCPYVLVDHYSSRKLFLLVRRSNVH